MGTGEDSVIINVKGSNLAYGVSGSTVDLGTGDDSIHITAAAGGNSAYSLYTATLIAGEGSDFLYLAANGIDASHSVAMNNSVIALGTTVDRADSKGAGDVNTLEIHGTIESSSKIYGTAGLDHVVIDGSVSKSIIDLGSGDDVLMLTSGLSGATLLGGSNNAVLQASGNGGLAHLGDILGLGGDTGHSLIGGNNSIFNSGNKISGFESLLLDLTDGNADTVNIDDLLNTVRDLYGAGKDMESLIIRGDQMDSVNLGSAQLMGESVRIEGQDGYYTYYQAHDADGDLVNLYIQQTITG
jgi:hypothetical protein